jgi:hypothetical protein
MRGCLASLAALGVVVVVFAALTVAAALAWRELFQSDNQHVYPTFVAVFTGIATVSFIAGSIVGNNLNQDKNQSTRTKRGDWSISSRSEQIGEPGPIWLLRESGFRYGRERQD